MTLTPQAGAGPRSGGRGVHRLGCARRLQAPVRVARRFGIASSTIRNDLATSRSSACSPIRTPRRAACPPTPATATTSTPCVKERHDTAGACRSTTTAVRSEIDERPRRDGRGALARHRAAGRRLDAVGQRPPPSATSRCSRCSPTLVMVVVITSAGQRHQARLPRRARHRRGPRRVRPRLPERAPRPASRSARAVVDSAFSSPELARPGARLSGAAAAGLRGRRSRRLEACTWAARRACSSA